MKIEILGLVALGLVTVFFGSAYRHLRGRRMPDISEEDFLHRFEKGPSSSSSAILDERRRIARVLGIPVRKLAPEYNFKDLANRFDHFGSFRVGWSDLDDEVLELKRDLGVEVSGEPLRSIGIYIAFVLDAKDRLSR